MPAAVLTALVLLAVVVVSGYVRSYPMLSPADELQHIDYLDRASGFGLVRAGDKFLEPSMREQACRRVDAAFDTKVPDCDERNLAPEDFQEDGFNTAYVHPPTYYVVTATIGRVVDVTPGITSWVTAGRLVGALWLGAAVVLTWFLLASLGVGLVSRVPLIVVMVCAPVTMFATATVTPDATALATGAGVLLAVVLWERGRAHWLWPAAACAFAIACKATNGIGVLVALGYLVIRYLQVRRAQSSEGTLDRDVELDAGSEAGGIAVATRHDVRDYIRVGVWMLVAIAMVSIAWLATSRAAQDIDPSTIPMVARFSVDSIGYTELRGNLTAGFTPLNGSYLPPFLREERTVRTFNVWGNVVVGAGAVIGLAYSMAGSRLRAVAISAVVVCALAGPMLVVANFVLSGIFVYIPPRYALSALPALLAATAVALERRVLLVGAYGFAGWMAFSVLLAMARA